MASIEKVKIIVVGDSGVGKSSLVHLIAHSEPVSNPSWTIGCSVEVKLHEYKEGTPFHKTYFVEMWDIGGSNNHTNSRGIFYNSFHGIILVHDLTNRKSKQNLRKWLAEVLSKDRDVKKNNGWYGYDSEQFGDSQIPILVIGTKQGLAMEGYLSGRTKRAASIAEECGADEIYVDCHQCSFAPGSSNAVKLSRYFDKVIEKKYQSQSTSYVSSIPDRRRLFSSYSSKQSHMD